MKYTILSPETEQRLATVDSLDLDWEVSVAPTASGGGDTIHRFTEAKVSVVNGMLEVMTIEPFRRSVYPVFCGHADGTFTVATVLGNIRLLATRGASLEGAAGDREAHKSIKSSMPGKILKILCKPGDTVEAGQPLLIIEAMKMENEIRAPQAGVVEEIPVQIGNKVETGELLVKLGKKE